MMTDLRARYMATLGLSGTNLENGYKDTLARAYALRSFEIEHYWKRATYFWGFQIAIFAAFGLFGKNEGQSNFRLIALALAALGTLTALANFLSAGGSKFWQKNWKLYIDMLEDEIKGRLHKTVWLENGSVKHSVSGINQRLTFCFFVFWVFILLYTYWMASGLSLLNWPDTSWFWPAIIVGSTAVGAASLFFKRTDIEGSIPNLDGTHGARIKVDWRGKVTSGTNPEFIRRYAPGEK